jgi:hypothetical protein
MEQLREEKENFTVCLCSNCDPDSAKDLVEAFKHLTTDNFNENITSREILIDIPAPPKVPKISKSRSVVKAETGKEPLDGELEQFSQFLVERFSEFHYNKIDAEYSEFDPEDHFGIFEARRVVVAFRGGASNEEIENLAGGEAHEGQAKHMLEQINEYIGKASYLDYLEEFEIQNQETEEAKRNEVAKRNQATLERRRQKADETKRRNLEKSEANKRQKLNDKMGN